MRDPEGSVVFAGDRVVRHGISSSRAVPLLKSAAGLELARQGVLVEYSFADGGALESPRIPFVTYPYEWCAAQLHDAAVITLELSRRILSARYELKDASAWNVIFDGCRPVFCDLLSPQPIARRQWWALGQYARHFILPLRLHKRGLLAAHEVFRMRFDGIEPARAAALLGARGALSSVWPLLHDRPRAMPAGAESAADAAVHSYHPRLYAYLQFALGRSPPPTRTTEWSNYQDCRFHYTEADLQLKRSSVDGWLRRLRPQWVLDLGCNTGEFSTIARDAGARVIAVDSDEDCISRVFRDNRPRTSIHPVLASVSDMIGGSGFGGCEFPGLATRMRQQVDCVMALGLVHHLFIGDGVQLGAVAALLSEFSRQFAIVELIPDTDPMALDLARRRDRSIAGWGCRHQLAAFTPYFEPREHRVLPGSGRELHLLQRLRRDGVPLRDA